MKELVAFLLPPATALAGTRISRFIFGKRLGEKFGFGLRFGLGLAVGMLVFSQTLLLAALGGVNLSGPLAWMALVWGAVEFVLLLPQLRFAVRQARFQPAHLWWLALLPVLYLAWLSGRSSVLEGTQEFDASAFWLIKARMLYLEQGQVLLTFIRSANLAYSHMDYPMMVPSLYALSYGAIGGVDEYIVKTWPFWMLAALCISILSLGRVWRQPHPAPILLVVFLCFLPASMQFVGDEGGTMPLVFGTSMAALLLVTGLAQADEMTVAAGVLVLADCVATKFEGIIYVALWAVILLFFFWRLGWLKSRVLWKAVAVAAAGLVPYFCFRLAKPVPHPTSAWLHDGAASAGAVLRRFPQTFFLSMGHRFCDLGFFCWKTADNNHLQFAGQWQGLNSFEGPELSILPWLLLLILALSFWKKPTHRLVLAAFLAVILGELAALALVISCLPIMQANLSVVIEFARDIIGRYYYPFFLACFLGTMALWFLDRAAAPDSTKPASAA
jgi:hypothetical protein